MRLFPVSFLSLLSASLLIFAFPEKSQADSIFYHSPKAASYFSKPQQRFRNFTDDISPTPTDGGIREVIPAKFEQRYQKWKAEFFAGEFGLNQWKKYESNKQFILTITVSSSEGQGAGTGEYKWNESDELVGATIDIGSKLDKGFPNPIYFPVMNSLSAFNEFNKIKSSIVAATKLAHEFGHVDSTARASSKFFRLQNNLMPAYNKILLGNGYNVQDQQLLDMVSQMGGTPVEIWENREYWGETNAMRYLIDRIKNELVYCSVLDKIESNLKNYAGTYQDRFGEIGEAKTLTDCRK